MLFPASDPKGICSANIEQSNVGIKQLYIDYEEISFLYASLKFISSVLKQTLLQIERIKHAETVVSEKSRLGQANL